LIVRPLSEWADGLPPARMLMSVVAEHAAQLGRLHTLRDYYEGKHAICARRRMSGLPNNSLVHAFPRYICTMTAGYLIGSPVRYAASGQEAALQALTDAFSRCAMDSVDAELARDAAVYGKGVELMFVDGEGNARSAAVKPTQAFVVYTDAVDAAPLLGVRATPVLRADGLTDGWRYDVYTREFALTYRMKEPCEAGFAAPERRVRHFFGGVPMVEFWNTDDERGDFEGAISLIDAYDLLQSDRLNDKQQFVDALLVLYGCTLETDAEGRTPGRQLREDKAIALPDGDARAEWLCKQLNETDTEVLKAAINADIHKMCMVPDMTDLNFAGNSSGVAMRYKLLGLEQLTRIKERWFCEGLRERVRRYARHLTMLGAPALDAARVEFRFTRALPVNELEVAKTVRELRGLVDDERLEKRASAAIGL
jgi:SPP1 family phage portal protein